MTERITSDDVLAQITRGCQAAVEKKYKSKISVLNTEIKRLTKQLKAEQKKRDPNSELGLKLKNKEVQLKEWERIFKKAVTELADKAEAFENLKKYNLYDLLEKHKKDRPRPWHDISNPQALRKMRNLAKKKATP